MNRVVISSLRTIFSVVVIVWLIYYLADNWNLFRGTLHASRAQLIALSGFVLVTWVLNSLQVLFLLRLEGVRVGFWENLAVQCGTLLGNYLPMRLGTVLRFRYFKKVHGLEYTRFGGIAGLRLVILIVAAGFLSAIGMAGFKAFSAGEVNNLLWVVFGGMTLIPLLGWYLSSRFLNLPEGRPGQLLKNLLSGFTRIRAQPGVAVLVMVLLLGQFAALSFRLYISFDIMQIDLSPWMLMMLAPMATLFVFLAITPGNLGLREWIIGVLSVAAGYQFDGAVFAGVVDRAVLMGCTFLFGVFGLAYLMIALRNSDPREKSIAS